MWPRVIEGMLGCWLGMSPFIFNHHDAEPWLWIVDWSAGTGIIVLACASYWRPTQHAHLAIIAVGIALSLFGYFYESHPVRPALQNDLIVGLLLLMLGIIPNHASKAPEHWEDFERRQAPTTENRT